MFLICFGINIIPCLGDKQYAMLERLGRALVYLEVFLPVQSDTNGSVFERNFDRPDYSSGIEALTALRFRSIFLNKPCKTVPGPTSITSFTPSAIMFFMI